MDGGLVIRTSDWLTVMPRICHSFMTSSLGCLLSLWQVGALVVRCLSESRPKLFNIFGSIIPKLIINKCLAIHSFPGIRGRIPFDSSILYRNTGMWTRFLFHYFVTYLSRWQYKSEYLPATLLAKTSYGVIYCPPILTTIYVRVVLLEHSSSVSEEYHTEIDFAIECICSEIITIQIYKEDSQKQNLVTLL